MRARHPADFRGAVALLFSLALHFVVLLLPELDWRLLRPWPEPTRLRVTLSELARADHPPGRALPPSPELSRPSDASQPSSPESLSAASPLPAEKNPLLEAEPPSPISPPTEEPERTDSPEDDTPNSSEGKAPLQDAAFSGLQGDLSYPRSGEVHYVLFLGTRGFEIGRSVLKWEISGDRYRLTLDAETTGAASFLSFLRSGSMRPLRFSMESVGRFGPFGFMPEQYRTWKNGEENLRAVFDWESGELRINDLPPRPLADNSQDLLSQMFQFGYSVFPQSLSAGAQAGEGVWVVIGRQYELVRFDFPVAGTLDLSAREAFSPALREGMPSFGDDPGAQGPGSFEALYLRSGDDHPVEFWLVPDALMLPLQIRAQLSDDGQTYELRARELILDDADGTDAAANPQEPLTTEPP